MSWQKSLKARYALLALGLLSIAAWLGYRVALPAYAASRITAELEDRGFPDARFSVRSVGPSRMLVRDLVLAPGLAVAEVEIRYRLRDLLDGRIDELVLSRAHWQIAPALDELRNNPAVRLVSGSAGSNDRPIPAIRIVDSMITLQGTEPIAFPVDADLTARADGLGFAVRSRVAGIPLQLDGRRGADADQTIEATARLGGPGSMAAASVQLRYFQDQLTLSIEARHDAAEVEHGGHRIAAALATLEGTVTLSGSRVVAADLQARGDDVRVDGLAAGELVVDVEERDRTLVAQVDTRGTWGAGWLRGELGDEPLAWAELPVPVLWELHGRLPDAARGVLATAGLTVPGAAEFATTGTAALRLDRGARRLEVAGAQLELDVAELSLPGLTLDATAVHANLDLSGVLARDRISVELRNGSRVRARRLHRGKVTARAVRVNGAGRLLIEGDQIDFERGSPLRIRAERIVRRDVAVENAEVAVPPTGRRARVSASTVSWDGVPLFNASGEVELGDGALDLEARWATGDGMRGRLSGRVMTNGDKGGHLALAVPPTIVRPGDRAHTLASKLAGIDVRGRASGSLRLDLGDRKGHSARLSLRDTTIERDGPAISGLVSDLELTSISPLRVKVAPSAFDLAGGRVRVEAFDLDPDDLDLSLALTLRGLSAGPVMALLSRGRAAATGRLDGSLQVRVVSRDRPRLILGDGELHAREPGRLRVRHRATIEALLGRAGGSEYGTVVRKRVAAALDDFRYSHLSLLLRGQPGSARLRIQGTGHDVPQDLDLTLNVGGLQRLADQAFRLWPRTHLQLSARRPRSPQ